MICIWAKYEVVLYAIRPNSYLSYMINDMTAYGLGHEEPSHP